jgi:hypothetical protein
MKLPQIQEKFIKNLKGIPSKSTQEDNVGAIKGKCKVAQSTENITPKRQ